MSADQEIDNIAEEVANECQRAVALQVKRYNPNKPGRDTRPRQREELIQLAAMAIRAIYDTIDNGKVYP